MTADLRYAATRHETIIENTETLLREYNREKSRADYLRDKLEEERNSHGDTRQELAGCTWRKTATRPNTKPLPRGAVRTRKKQRNEGVYDSYEDRPPTDAL